MDESALDSDFTNYREVPKAKLEAKKARGYFIPTALLKGRRGNKGIGKDGIIPLAKDLMTIQRTISPLGQGTHWLRQGMEQVQTSQTGN